MNTRFFLALSLLLAAPLLDAALDSDRIGQDTLTLHDSGRVRTFLIARDEVGTIEPGGHGHVQKIAPAADAEAMRQRAGNADLILYEQGQPRTEAHRRWLTPRVLAKVRAGADVEAIATDVGAVAVERPAYAPDHAIFTAPAGASNGLTLANALRRRAEIESAEPLLARTMAKRFTPNDPFFADNAANAGYQWHLQNTGARGGTAGVDVNVTTAWGTVKGAGVRIGIVDDGIELAHPDLAAHVDTINDYDFNGGDADPSAEFGDDHGTAVAGIAAAIGNNGLGVSGVAPEATLVALRLIAGPVTDAEEAAAFTRRADIIEIKSNSWGPYDSGDIVQGPGLLASFALQDAIANGRAGKGTLFFWAAGDGGAGDNSNFDGYANSIFTSAIAAIGDNGQRSDTAEDGANILVAAPSSSAGRQSISTTDRTGADRDNGYNDGTGLDYTDANFTNTFGGTSAACPLAAGIGALLLESNPNLTWRDVKEILIRTATRNDSADADWQNNGAGFHFNHKYGAGLINAAAAVTMAQTWTLLPAMSSMTKSNAATGAIPDNNATGVTRSFVFAASEYLRVESVMLAVDITHPRRGELEIELTSPSGAVSRLGTQRASDFAADLQWTFSSVHHWGESAVGVWTVAVKDRGAGNTGTLNSVALTLYGSGALITGAPVLTSAGTAGGPQGSPFSYQITATQSPTSFGASGLPAGLAVSSLTGLISGTPVAQGVANATLSATNALGTGTLPLTITVGPSLGSLVAEAVDQPTLPFLTELPHPWFRQTTETHDGSDAARSAAIGDNQSSTLTLDLTGPVVLSFWWKVSSQPDAGFGGDALSFLLDRFVQFQISGEVAWQRETVFIPEGMHMLEWSYGKDNATAAGLDAGFVDQVALLPFALSPPIITVQPSPLLVAVGGTAVFCVEAASARPPSYQWMRNNVAITGATARCYLFTAAAASAGSYSCRVTNLNGSTDSAAAVLTVNAASSTLANAVDTTTFAWTTAGDLPVWARTAAVALTHDGIDAARAAGLAVGASTTLHTTLLGPGTLTFWWRCDGEADYDFLDFNVDGNFYDEITGGTPYTSATWYIPPGLHTLDWTYFEDEENAGANIVGRGLLDQVVFTPSAFGVWQTANFTLQQRADELISGPDADPNHDGVTNLAAYAFGIPPLAGGGAPLPRAALAGAERSVIYQKNTAATDVSFFVEHTTDLLDEFSWAAVSTTDSILGTVGSLQTIKAVVPADPSLHNFYRLRLELAE